MTYAVSNTYRPVRSGRPCAAEGRVQTGGEVQAEVPKRWLRKGDTKEVILIVGRTVYAGVCPVACGSSRSLSVPKRAGEDSDRLDQENNEGVEKHD